MISNRKLLYLQNNVRNYFVQQNNLRDQVVLYRDAVENYGRLLQAERDKFELGESSLFLINSRERMYIQVRLKLAELISKFNISKSGLQYAGGVLHQNS